MVDSVCNSSAYKMPTLKILENRRVFYGLRRENGDSVDRWLKRVEIRIGFCEYPTTYMKHLLIDRFISGLNDSEFESIKEVSQHWTLEQLVERILDEHIDDIGHSNDKQVHQFENFALDVIKSEPVGPTL